MIGLNAPSILLILLMAMHKPPAKIDALFPGPFEAGKLIDPVVCKSDPGQSYALYIPANHSKDALPIVYFFDPHADGSLPLKKYQSLADAFGFIMVGSNNSKNGNDWPATENIWTHLLDDTKSRLRINLRRMYTCGFSGGAKVASYLALNDPEIKGVIANGAALPDGTPAGDFQFSFTAIAGEGDMNMTDLVAVSKDLDNTRTRHHLILFSGKHEWAPRDCMQEAFAGFQFDAMQMALIPKDPAFISRYSLKSKTRLQTYLKTDQLIKAAQESALSISFLDRLTDESAYFKEKAAAIAKDPRYQRQRQVQEELLTEEQNTKEQYMQHFQQNDPSYWAQTINDLQTRANGKTLRSAMYQRLLAYLSLAFYSLSNRMINSYVNEEAWYFVELYEKADPANSEAWYFAAILHARQHNAKAAETDLQKAVSCGFTDEKRMLQQPEFQSLSSQINLSGIGSKMHHTGPNINK